MELTFTQYVSENFGNETLDMLIKACNTMESIDFENPSIDFVSKCIYLHDNYKKIVEVSEFVDGITMDYNIPSGWDYFDIWYAKHKYKGVMMGFEFRQAVMIGESAKSLINPRIERQTRHIIKAVV